MNRDAYRYMTAMAVFMLILYFVLSSPAPYVVYKPGLAADVGPMVSVAQPDVREGSVIMLTTVRQSYPNWAMYIAARFNPNWDIYRKRDIFQEGETQREYAARQQFVMLSSQASAMQAAYRALDIPYEIRSAGVVVARTIEGMPAEDVLRPGDRIVEVNGEPVSTGQDLAERVSGMQVGEKVRIVYERDGERREREVAIGDFARAREGESAQRSGPGLGVMTMTLLEVEALDPAHQIRITVDDIGGPSAGIIFALEMVDQLSPGDLTRGYRIAGTGTIDPEGHVGEIGGAGHKVVAAEREGADLFFVPKGNEREARAKAEQIGAALKVVAVATLQEALDYLASLPPKDADAAANS